MIVNIFMKLILKGIFIIYTHINLLKSNGGEMWLELYVQYTN